MDGIILNVHDDVLPEGSPWRTRRVACWGHEPVLVLPDGTAVWEVWFWSDQRWWCFSRAYDAALARSGVIYFDGLEQLRAQLRVLRG